MSTPHNDQRFEINQKKIFFASIFGPVVGLFLVSSYLCVLHFMDPALVAFVASCRDSFQIDSPVRSIREGAGKGNGEKEAIGIICNGHHQTHSVPGDPDALASRVHECTLCLLDWSP